MKTKIFAFIKPSETATMFSHKMAMFVSQQLDEPVIWDDSIAKADMDNLIIIGGGIVFCSHLPALAKAVLRAEKVVYCTNDYKTTKIPASDNTAKSPFRAAFRKRHKQGMSAPLVWSTLQEADAYVNWNALAWEPNFEWNEKRPKNLIYHGSWRRNRIEVFDLFFSNPKIPTVISNHTNRFQERYPKCEHIGSITPDIVGELTQFGLGLYLKDPQSEVEPPACRFYEMLSAGLPMVFHKPCLAMFEKAGYTLHKDELVTSSTDIPKVMKRRVELAYLQKRWRSDYRNHVTKQFQKAMRSLQ
jgi:hypothetical protein